MLFFQLPAGSSEEVLRLQKQIVQAREVIEQLEADRELAIAEVKKQVHEAIEEKDKELRETRNSYQALRNQMDELTQQKELLEKQGQNSVFLIFLLHIVHLYSSIFSPSQQNIKCTECISC